MDPFAFVGLPLAERLYSIDFPTDPVERGRIEVEARRLFGPTLLDTSSTLTCDWVTCMQVAQQVLREKAELQAALALEESRIAWAEVHAGTFLRRQSVFLGGPDRAGWVFETPDYKFHLHFKTLREAVDYGMEFLPLSRRVDSAASASLGAATASA